MLYCKVENGTITQGPGRLPKDWQNADGTSKLSLSELKIQGWLPLYVRADTFDANSEYLEEQPLEVNSDHVLRHYAKQTYSEEAKWQALSEEKAKRIAEFSTDLSLSETVRQAAVDRINAQVDIQGVRSFQIEDLNASDKQFPEYIDKISQAELYFRQIKNSVKTGAITFIKTNPECSEQDLIASFETEQESAAMVLMLPYYISGAYGGELIAENTFDAFRDFVVATPVEQLEEI